MTKITTQLSQISIFPIKSLGSLQVQSSPLLSSGALKGDREFAIFDAVGRVVNANGMLPSIKFDRSTNG